MTKTHYLPTALAIVALGFMAASCSSDDEPVKMAQSVIVLEMPEGLENVTFDALSLDLRNISTGQTATLDVLNPTESTTSAAMQGSEILVTAPEGMYTISLDGEISYIVNGQTFQIGLRGQLENTTLAAVGASTLRMKTYLYKGDDTHSFVISEVFCSGTLTPEGKTYMGDSYFKIYNNSSETLYADGLVIAETTFLSNDKQDYEPNIMAEAVTISAAYRIPGSGHDVPVGPGESLLICDIAKNHKADNPNSFDLSKADFEWFDESSNPDFVDVDTDAPNLETVLKTSMTVWQPHMRGCKSYILCYLGGDKDARMSVEDYLQQYFYIYTYNFVFDGEVYPMGDYDGYKIPNSWVIDCVNLAIADEAEWLVVDPSLDRGYTYMRETFSDNTSYGLCVRRKALSGSLLQDTNDSSADFLPRQDANPWFAY